MNPTTRLQSPASEAPWIKLCGLRDPVTAAALAALHPQAIGLNFYHPSPRFVDRQTARAICDNLPREIMTVGVFVNAPLQEMIQTAEDVDLRGIQLHGDEPPELVAQLRQALPKMSIIRAWRAGDAGLEPLAAYLEECETPPDAILIDARLPGAYGGTGHTAPWNLLRDYPADWPPLILAGGLHSDNVAEALHAVRPFGVDAASGIESSPGVKDPARAAAFVTAARLTRPDNRP